MHTFYTISTQSHLFKSFALRDSLQAFGYLLKIIVVDSDSTNDENIIPLSTLHSDLIHRLQKKYSKNSDALRWSLKSAIGLYFLENGYDEIIYIDNDIYFFNSPVFLIEKLNRNHFLLTPHYYKTDTKHEQNWLEANFRVGLYNAGFFGANQNAKPIVEWWADCCLYAIEKHYWRGLFVDQKYLDLVPVKFEEIEIVKNREYNLAGWNDDSFSGDKKDVVFVHFAGLTMERWRNKTHPLNSLYEKYLTSLRKYKSDYKWKKNRWTVDYWKEVFYYIRWKLKHG